MGKTLLVKPLANATFQGVNATIEITLDKENGNHNQEGCSKDNGQDRGLGNTSHNGYAAQNQIENNNTRNND